MERWCACGCRIWIDWRWNGLAYIADFYDSRTMGEEISHCPGCGRRLRFDELLDRPPAQMDIAIELEHHVSAIREIRNRLQHIEESLTGYGPLITEKMEYCVDSLGPVPEKLTSVRDLLEKVAVNQ